MIDTGSIITIVIAIVIVYLLIKFIISPLLKLISGIIIILLAIFILGKYFNVSFNQFLGPIANIINIDNWIKNIGDILNSLFSGAAKLFSILDFLNKK